MRKRKLWSCLLEVKPLKSSRYKKWGNAFVKGIIYTNTKRNAILGFKKALKNEFTILSHEDLKDFDKQILNYKVSAKLLRMGHLSRITGTAQFTPFFTWKK